MKTGLRISLILSLIACSLGLNLDLASGAEKEAKISRVVLIGVDGAGAFFKQADTPNLDKIFENGAITYTCVTSNPTISAQSWGSMLHGVTPEFHGLTNGIVSKTPFPTDSIFPSVFRVIRENMPEANLASFCNWNPVNIGIIEDGLGVVKDHGANDSAVTDMACDYLEKNDPTLLFVHYDEVDGAGHGHVYGSEKHLQQIHTTDGYIKRIYDVLVKRDMIDSTLFIVTADHGGNGHSHGGWTDGEKYIMFAATGPGVQKKGEIGEMGVRDTSSVVLYALGLIDKQPKTWTSRVPSGLFEGVVAGERPVYEIEYAYPHRTHEVSATPTGDASVPAALGKDRVRAYFPLDGDVKDALGKVDSKQNGKLYFIDGYFSKGAQFDDGSILLPGVKLGKKSFSVACWFKTSGVDEDPAIISNKNWNNGLLNGFVLALRSDLVKFNVGNGSKRMDEDFRLPIDFRDGWVYAVLVVDREAGEIRFSYDFGKFAVEKIADELKDVDFDSDLTLTIGSDGTGKYKCPLTATLDDVLLIDGALTDKDLETLKGVYQAR